MTDLSKELQRKRAVDDDEDGAEDETEKGEEGEGGSKKSGKPQKKPRRLPKKKAQANHDEVVDPKKVNSDTE